MSEPTRWSEPIQRGDILEKRRQLMQAWADYCSNGEQTAANVVPLRA
jgi:hypothetical protein